MIELVPGVDCVAREAEAEAVAEAVAVEDDIGKQKCKHRDEAAEKTR